MPVRLLAYCLLPNHFHLVVWPRAAGDLSRWMQWLLTAHVRRHSRKAECNRSARPANPSRARQKAV